METLHVTAAQIREIDRLAAAAGRDPATIRRAYTLFGPWDPRHGRHGRFSAVGVTEFVLDWPGEGHIDEFEKVATEVIPALRR